MNGASGQRSWAKWSEKEGVDRQELRPSPGHRPPSSDHLWASWPCMRGLRHGHGDAPTYRPLPWLILVPGGPAALLSASPPALAPSRWAPHACLTGLTVQ